MATSLSESSSLIETDSNPKEAVFGTETTFPPRTSRSWCGRYFSNRTTIIGRATAAVAAIGVPVLVYVGIDFFQKYGYSLTASLATGAGIGLCIPLAIGLGLPEHTGKKVLDFMSKWSFAGFQVSTQFALNAGFPISGIGLWDPTVPVSSVVYGSNMYFGALATFYLSLHLRSIIFKKADPEPSDLEPFKKNRLFLEYGTDNIRGFAVEQFIKLGVAGSLLTVELLGINTGFDLELKYLSFFLFSGIAGSTGSLLFYKLKDTIEKKYPVRTDSFGIHIPWPTRTIRIAQIVSYLVSAPLMGILFTIKSPYTLLGVGFLYSSHKISALRRFENVDPLAQSLFTLTSSKKLPPMKWKSVDTIAQGIFVTLGCSWFIVGMSDPTNTMYDRLYLSSMIVSALASYPLTRALLQRKHPQERSKTLTKLLNSLQFYIVDNPSLYLPYFIRRFSGTLGGSVQPNSTVRAIEDTIAWDSFGATWGSHTAFNGGFKTTEDSSPIEISPIIVIACSTVLASKGTLGGV